ncbi:hypothetical protein PAXRUDRAFT_718514 [Paxillus rubicundulus Ve08.2h10]|uniref:Uncharacterized protein n=1 Tax=Paxillus rubicundulus Ve08.2h10 TaxID=930991 RepID=A0A0D0D2T7_9AGAM|nr:hypothetical protein PAXRUDRAFT_718514 [Paxillus rubicundulus Ve08.2h10]
MAQHNCSSSSRTSLQDAYSSFFNFQIAMPSTAYGPPSSGVVSYPGAGMDPSPRTVSPYNGHPNQNGSRSRSGSVDTNRDSTKTPTPTVTSFPRPMVPAHNGVSPQPWLYSQLPPQPQPEASSLPRIQSTFLPHSSSPISGPQPPSAPSPASTSEQSLTAIPAPSRPTSELSLLFEPLLTPLKAFQTQFTAFEADFNAVQIDITDALAELRAIRNAQKQMEKRVGVLEGVIGVSARKTRCRGRGSGRGKARGRGGKMNAGEATIDPEHEVEGVEVAFEPENSPTFIHRFAAIESAIEELLSRESGPCEAHLPVIRREATTSPPPSPRLPPVASNLAQEHSQLPLPQSTTALPWQQPTLKPISAILPAYDYQSAPSLPPSTSALAPKSGTLPLIPALPAKRCADAGVQACPSSPTQQVPSACSISSRLHGPGLTPFDRNADSGEYSQHRRNWECVVSVYSPPSLCMLRFNSRS